MSFQPPNPFDELPDNVKATIPDEIKRKVAEHQELQAALFELAKLTDALRQDIFGLANSRKDIQHELSWRRAAYRATFAWIEGVVYQMKQVAFKTQGGYYQAQFSRAEIAFLLEEAYYLKDKGEAKPNNRNFSEIDKNLRFAFSMLTKGFNIQTKLVAGTKEWEEFQKAIDVRNHLTHPKKHDDLTVTDEDMASLTTTVNWFNEQTSQLIKDMSATIAPKVEEIRSIGRTAIQAYNNRVMKHFGRAGEVGLVARTIENTLALFNETDGLKASPLLEELLDAKSKLDALKADILKEINQ